MGLVVNCKRAQNYHALDSYNFLFVFCRGAKRRKREGGDRASQGRSSSAAPTYPRTDPGDGQELKV